MEYLCSSFLDVCVWILSTIFIFILLTFNDENYVEKSNYYCFMNITQISSKI
jgi:hypothetical protein